MNSKSAFQVIGSSHCTGCSVCAAVCPAQAILMEENVSGFLEPVVTSECTNCEMCCSVCPVLNSGKFSEAEPLAIYAAWSNSADIVEESSSGGLFSEIAGFVREGGGTSCGAIMVENRAHHVISDDVNTLRKMRGSKYIQSKTLTAFKKVCSSVDSSTLFFCGTPCQVQAIKNLWCFLKKDENKLITCDVVCHGVPSYHIYDSYIKLMSKNQKIVSVNFRDKIIDWQHFCLRLTYSDGKSEIRPHRKDVFYRCYIYDIALRESCYRCQFSKIPRVGDITLGDFWGAPLKLNNSRGTSAVLVNSKKGLRIIDSLVERDKIVIKKVDLEDISKRNARVVSGIHDTPKNRSRFLKEVASQNLMGAYRKFVIPLVLRKKIRTVRYLIKRLLLKKEDYC